MKAKKLAQAVGLTLACTQLSGCIIAAAPLLMAATAATVAGVAVAGFAVYKTVQTSTGGTVKVAFGSKDAKHAPPPVALNAGPFAAVMPGGARERSFYVALRDSKKFRVLVPPDSLANLQASMETGGADQQQHAFEAVCRASRVGTVFADFDLGQSVKSNMLSFNRGVSVQRLQLEAYACQGHRVIWSEDMAVQVEAGSKPTPQAEIDAIAGKAWAERILQAAAS